MNLKQILVLGAGATILSCAPIQQKNTPYSNYLLPQDKGLKEIEREGDNEKYNVPLVSTDKKYLYIMSYSYDNLSKEEAVRDSYDRMLFFVRQLEGVDKLGKYAEIVCKSIITVDKAGREKYVAEILYAIPLAKFSPNVRDFIVGRSDKDGNLENRLYLKY